MASTPFIVRNGQGSREMCIDAELLARYIDGGATAEERTRVEAHLARCQDCYFVFSETFQAQGIQGDEAAASDVKPTPWRASMVWRTAAGLAAAAVVVITLQRGRSDPRQDRLVTALNELQAVAGPSRTFEGRLSGAYPYRPLAAPVRSGSGIGEPALAVREAALNVELAAPGNSPEERRALAIMYLTRREPQRAAEVVTPLAQSTSDAALLNDAAVALLATGRQDDATRAKELLEQVVARDPNRAEAWFNLALAAEAGGDVARARAAWTRYLVIDPSSPWAAEAREHLGKSVGLSAQPQIRDSK